MNISKISSVIFSATDTTKSVISTLTESLPLQADMIDITPEGQEKDGRIFSQDELVVFGVPVYGGRVPLTAVNKIVKMRGNSTPAVVIAVYGNRDYDDALLELKNIIEDHGFKAIAAAAFIAEHSIMHSVAQGRPDEKDKQKIRLFAEQVWNKVQNSETLEEAGVTVPGNIPYREYNGVPFKPHALKMCTGCGLCAANCPAGAIDGNDPKKTDEEKCISCMRCMKVCPSHARSLDQNMLAGAEKSFAEMFSARREPEIFLAYK